MPFQTPIPSQVYTPEQVKAYFNYISLPQKFHPENHPPLDIDFLTTLFIHQITTIPYENLSLHYNNVAQDKKVILEPQFLFDKFVTRASGRGGYCMEGSLFFVWMLRTLGFDAYSTGARIKLRVDGVPQGNYMGMSHIVNIITLPTGEKYVCDAAFGGDGMTRPMPLEANTITQNLGTQQIRYIYDSISQLPARTPNTTPSKFWIYQYRNSPTQAWNSFYCFREEEYLLEDFNIMSYFASTSAESFSTYTVVVVAFLREEGESKVRGKVMLVDGAVKRNLGGKTEIVQVCETEEERVEALRGWFGIRLSEGEILGIRGYVSQLKRAEITA
ncbi:cysteine proteinase [Tothia fuscella]|uniref:Cysteine proteinase n=1 Tax=Tothia fuscella TaxID=1048955 RepID=A0A9P4TV69_9PEZI|nr:cysteine proteinase [Tothia fuscella]